jgi:hypothetical protein
MIIGLSAPDFLYQVALEAAVEDRHGLVREPLALQGEPFARNRLERVGPRTFLGSTARVGARTKSSFVHSGFSSLTRECFLFFITPDLCPTL